MVGTELNVNIYGMYKFSLSLFCCFQAALNSGNVLALSCTDHTKIERLVLMVTHTGQAHLLHILFFFLTSCCHPFIYSISCPLSYSDLCSLLALVGN